MVVGHLLQVLVEDVVVGGDLLQLAVDEAGDEVGEPLVVLVEDLVLEGDVLTQLGQLDVLGEVLGVHLLQASAQRGDVLPVGGLLLDDALDHALKIIVIGGEGDSSMYRTNCLIGLRHRRGCARAARRRSSRRLRALPRGRLGGLEGAGEAARKAPLLRSRRSCSHCGGVD